MNFQDLCKEADFNKLIELAAKHDIEVTEKGLEYYQSCLNTILQFVVNETDEERVIHLEKTKDWYEAYFIGPNEEDKSKQTNYALDFQSWSKVASYKIDESLTKEEQFLLVLCAFDDLTFYGLDY